MRCSTETVPHTSSKSPPISGAIFSKIKTSYFSTKLNFFTIYLFMRSFPICERKLTRDKSLIIDFYVLFSGRWTTTVDRTTRWSTTCSSSSCNTEISRTFQKHRYFWRTIDIRSFEMPYDWSRNREPSSPLSLKVEPPESIPPPIPSGTSSSAPLSNVSFSVFNSTLW